MTKSYKYLFKFLTIFGTVVWLTSQALYPFYSGHFLQLPDEDSIMNDTTIKATGPQFKLKDDPAYPASDLNEPEGIQLKRPSNIKSEVEYDPATGQYIFTNKIGNNIDYRRPSTMTLDEYKKYDMERTIREYWREQANGGKSASRGFAPGFTVGGEVFQKVFGGNTINIIPQGEAQLIFGGSVSTNDNPMIQRNLRKVWSFDFDEKINMNVTGTIGERVKLGLSYNTDAMFEFENQTKLEYNGDEDAIVKKVEAGDVTLPLPGTLITGSQSLFGIKTELQFGKLNVTTVLSQQRGQTQVVQVQGGAQVTPFEITADEYEANKHFFLSQSFASNYDNAHKNLPRITSNITITRIEVWITNKNKANVENVRSIYAFTDLGERETANLSNPSVVTVNPSAQSPYNEANSLYNQVKDAVRNNNDNVLKQLSLRDGIDYEKIKSARRLNDNEFTYDRNLGYISLNTSLNNDEVIGVAYEYTINGKTYKVGDLSTDITASKMPLVLKMLKGTNLSPSQKTWRLMMKNIYSLNAYDLSSEDFYLDVLYHDDSKGSDINYIPEKTGKVSEIILLRLLNLDRVNSQMEDHPDGVFDFIDQVTIDKKYGRIIFPMREPFGRYLDSVMRKNGVLDPLQRQKYVYNELYDSTKTKAQLVSEKNKFKLKGTFKSSSSSEIFLNASNIPQGSVKVSVGGIPLTENIDYIVDYSMGSVKITNSGVMSSGQPIKISLESNSMFNIQTKTLLGTHLDYKINDDFNIGATILHLSERPLTNKVNIGDEPVSNTIWGLNTTYRTKSQFLTTLVDKLPLLQTKEPSTITFTGEFADLIPGSSKAIGKNGVAYIDDFEGSETKYDLKQFYGWSLASTPSDFVESNYSNDMRYNYNRAKLSWYIIDQSFYQSNTYTPTQVKQHKEWLQSNEAREVYENELFPNKQIPNGVPTNIYTFNMTYYPDIRGPYNLNTQLTPEGNLNNPEQRWGGIMKSLQTTDFEATNIAYIEFWMMDPFIDDSSNTGGDLYFNLGDISEDILKDGQMSFEQGLPVPGDTTPIENTVWGKVAQTDPLTKSFTNGTNVRKYQDVGLDGLNDDDEKTFFSTFLNQIQSIVSPEAYKKIAEDPAADDFKYFTDPSYDETESNVNDRYKDYNGVENNSPEAGTTYAKSSYSTPDMEDINDDNTLNDKENYYEYKVDLRPNLQVGESYVVSERKTSVNVLGKKVNARWLQFKIPIENFDKRFGDIEDFKSIRFLRMFLTGFNKKTTLRFATLDLVRSEWRKYQGSLIQGNEGLNDQVSTSDFDIQAINIEENTNYCTPPGISREIDPSQPQLILQNEQSMVLKVDNIKEGDARAGYKSANLDARNYKRLKMEVHCEPLENTILNDGDVTVFIRLGSDNKNNYYEYEVPMKVTKNNDITDPGKIWPEENKFDIDLNIFQQIKQARNDANVPLQQVYHKNDGKNNVYICGNPSLSEIKVLMIGVRNPTAKNNSYQNDGLNKSAEVWVDELRLTDFSDKGGWAANARAQIKLADFGNVRLAGSTVQPGFGSLESKVNDREKAQTNQYDLSGDFEMGKFFPSKAQVQIPLYMAYSLTRIKPEYNPLDPDIPLQAALDNAPTKAIRDSILKMSIDKVMRRSINLTNVRVNKTSKTPQFYDPANFSASYGYNEQLASNYKTEFNNIYHHEGSFNYIFNNRPKNIAPFQKIKFFNKPYFRLIRDFNFYYEPTSISFRTNMVKDFHTLQLRNLNKSGLDIPLTIEKNFTWNRMYDIKYDLSRSLKVDFSATNVSYIDQWDRTMDSTLRNDPRYNTWKQIKNGGHNKQYTHQFNINYTIPINKLPLLDWVSASARYGGSYQWQLQPKFIDENNVYNDLGNSISNTRTLQLNSNVSLSSIYNKVQFFRDLQGQGRGKGNQQQKEKKTVSFEKKYFNLKSHTPRNISHNLKTEDVTIKVTDANGKEVKGTMQVATINRITFTPDSDVAVANVRVEGKIDVGPNPFEWIVRNTTRLLIGLKSINGSYTETNGTSLSGYMKGTKFFGMSGSAPGIPFILGDQSESNIRKMVENDWILSSNLLQANLVRTTTKTIALRANYEPFQGCRVDLNTNYSRSYNKDASYLSLKSDTNYLLHYASPIETGNFTMTIISIRSFEKLNSDNFINSKYFKKFKENRYLIISNLEKKYANKPSFYNDPVKEPGFNENSQQVLIPAFLATYGGYDINSNSILDLFPAFSLMRPNWRININSLTQIPFLSQYFQSINLTHAYTSNYNIGSYITNSIYEPSTDGFSNVRDQLGNYAPMFDVSSISINEQFSPLFGIDMTMKNNLTGRFEYKKSRIVMLGLTNYTLNENYSTEYVFGAGYRFPDIPLTMITFGAVNSPIKSDLNLRADISIRDDIFFIRRLDIEDQKVTNGNRNVKISFSADYQLSNSLTVQAFYDRLLTDPHISSSYKTINTKFGFNITFRLTQ
jgi:cell surface protein SprA